MIDWNPIAEKFREADAILIGASNGLSITEGLHLFADNAAFDELFGDFKQKYGLHCILQGMMAGWPSEEERWAFWARLIHHYCGQYRPTPVMNDLRAIVGEKDYFVVTSNGEGHFELCGFDPTKIYEIEGNWFTMQCARPCHDTLYSSLEVAEKLSVAEQGGHVPTELVPRCPKCGGPMDIHMGAGQRMIPDTAAHKTVPKLSENLPRKETGGSGAGHWLAQSADQGPDDAPGGRRAKRHLCDHQSGGDLHCGQYQREVLRTGRAAG
ncbi:MAG: hypothetical protein ACLR8P_20015 [Clostridium fessum]